jgi:hypothetical protein
VTNQHDPVDAWLEREVTPLRPPPGSLERIRTRARRRKRNQAFVVAAGCAVIIGAAAAVPQIASALQGTPGPGHTTPAVGLGSSAPSVKSPSRGSTSPESATATPSPQHSTLTPGTPANDPVPAGFQPTSVTFVGNGTGGLVGAVIGQAGGGKCATEYCTSLAQTSDYGATWSGLSAPLTGPPQGATGVSQLRFLNLKDGWAFGPGLWATTSGGWPWQQENTYGMRVTDLEASNGRAFAVFASCQGASDNYAGDCTSFRLYTSTAGSNRWGLPVSMPYPFVTMNSSAPSSVTIAIGGSTSTPTAYVLAPSGELLSAPVSSGAFTEAGKAPCSPGPAQPDGQPADAHLSAFPSLVIACGSGTTTTIWTSASGANWTKTGSLNTPSPATSLSAAPGGKLIMATDSGLYYSPDNGKTWQAAAIANPPAGGFSYVGTTNATQGVALPADASLGEIFVTSDGGQTWAASPVRG